MRCVSILQNFKGYYKYTRKRIFVRDGILSVADYNSTRVGVVVVVVIFVAVVVADFFMGSLKNALSYKAEILHEDLS